MVSPAVRFTSVSRVAIFLEDTLVVSNLQQENLREPPDEVSDDFIKRRDWQIQTTIIIGDMIMALENENEHTYQH